MSAEPVVDVFTVVLCLRLMDMAQMCGSLSLNCGAKGKEAHARRLKKAQKCFNDMLTEIETDAKQLDMS